MQYLPFYGSKNNNYYMQFSTFLYLNSTIVADVTGSTIAGPPVEDSRQTSMWNITSSRERQPA